MVCDMKKRNSRTLKMERVAVEYAKKFLNRQTSLIDLKKAFAEYESAKEKEQVPVTEIK